MLGQRKAPIVAGAVICGFALVPGLPKLPFLLIGGGLFFAGRALARMADERAAAEAAEAARPTPVSAQNANNPYDALAIDPLNAEARDALDRIRKARLLEKEKQELIELIERVLEAESDKESE